jgi:hypothetical protein
MSEEFWIDVSEIAAATGSEPVAVPAFETASLRRVRWRLVAGPQGSDATFRIEVGGDRLATDDGRDGTKGE